jgi:2,3-bisphosphoglycerate-dependent phosphoglycerate mutase
VTIELWLARHAQPDWEPGGRAVDDPGLSEVGSRQAELLAKALADERFDAIYRSPIRRAAQTAAPLEDQHGWTFCVHSWLAELGLPTLEGRTPEDVQEFFQQARLRDLEQWWDGLPGGESFRHFQERVTAGIEGLLLEDHRLCLHESESYRIWKLPEHARRILVVAHAGTNAIILAHLLGLEPVPWAWMRFHSPHAGITRMHTAPVASGCVWVLREFGSTTHLQGAPITW